MADPGGLRVADRKQRATIPDGGRRRHSTQMRLFATSFNAT